VFEVLLHTPDAAERVAHVGEFFLYRTVIPPAARALTWLVAARELDCGYAWEAALPAARTAGVNDALIAALEGGRTMPALAAEERTLLDFCHQLLRGNHHVTDRTYGETIAAFGVPAAVQIAATVGYVVMMSIVANAFDVPPVDDASRPAL
jgi:4-carboxymuconolactone decarboxylase